MVCTWHVPTNFLKFCPGCEATKYVSSFSGQESHRWLTSCRTYASRQGKERKSNWKTESHVDTPSVLVCTQVAYQKLDGIVFNILNQTKMLFTALFVFLIVGRRSLRSLRSFRPLSIRHVPWWRPVSVFSVFWCHFFFAQLRAAVKSAVFGIGHSHRGRLDAVSQLLYKAWDRFYKIIECLRFPPAKGGNAGRVSQLETWKCNLPASPRLLGLKILEVSYSEVSERTAETAESQPRTTD